MKDGIVFLLGRFQPMTIGHGINIDFAKNVAKSMKYDFQLFTTHTHDSTKNPIEFNEKIKLLNKFFCVETSTDREMNNPFIIIKNLSKVYNNIVFVVGEDRYEEFQRLNLYIEEFGCKNLNIICSGARVSDVSGTAMRNFVKLNNFEKFKENMPLNSNIEDAQYVFELVKSGLKIK